MIELRTVPLASVQPPVPKILQRGWYVRFTNLWPSTMEHVSGKLFEIESVNQVSYELVRKLPSNDWADIDLSNAATGVNLYPDKNQSLFEVWFGFKPGNYIVHTLVPADRYLHNLEQSTMYPSMTSATLRYLGGLKPEESPYNDPRLVMYFVNDLESIVLRLLVDTGIDFEKIVIGVLVNKCKIKEIKAPSQEMVSKSKELQYFDEIRW